MAYRRFGVRLAFVAGFAFAVLLLQMLAVSRLSNPTRPPWDYEHEAQREAAQPLAQSKIPELRTLQPPPLEHENPEKAVEETEPPTTEDTMIDVVKFPRNLKDVHARILNQMRPINSTQPEETTQPMKIVTTPSTKEIPSLQPIPLPPSLRNCDIKSKKDAQSAISRATSDECKALIHNVTCLGQAGKLYDDRISNMCPKGKNPGKGVEMIPYSQGTGPNPRVVFLFSVHGRGFRQVMRLFKAIFHSDHYFFIHVDSRSDYLHRKLYETISDLPNVYFPTWRMATIWGGASLLQMLLRAMEDLEFVLTDWKWDFFINLSESDYPLKTNDELVKFLRVHRSSNFVKTHGGDINKFIQKQGLDRTFVECDNHMWRVDNRKLPPDITVDGGSDWIAINRNYSRYLVTEKHPYLVGLKRYYEFSLLPAESFFHTVIRNGPMCETFVKTNLRVTNWNRKLGCRCQYKHIVDWCGCSPNDFLAKDIGRLKNSGDHHFFARKFEAIVNHEVVNLLDGHLYGFYPEDTPGLHSYWESVYHMDDDISRPSNARYSTYQSFLRQSLKLLYSEQTEKGGGEDCQIPKQAVVKDVLVLRKSDEFSGFIVTFRDAMSDKLNPAEFETYFTPVRYVKRHTLENDLARRIWSLEIGSEWDGKESIFRNYGSILGVWDEPVAAVRLTMGKLGEVNIIWEDPTGERIATYSMKLEANWFVSFHKPRVEKPIKPGVWSVYVELRDGTPIMETKFLVVPITHENMVHLSDPQSINARRANSVKPGMDSKEYVQWRNNVSKSGAQLDEWLDELVGEAWKLEGFCRTEIGNSSRCSWLPDCTSASWSTFSPDPKSEIGDIQPNGRIRI